MQHTYRTRKALMQPCTSTCMIVAVLFFITSLHSLQVCLVHRPLRLSSCHVYASRLLGVVLCPQGYHPHLSHAFGIIAAFIAYYVSLSELLASEPEAVSTVLPIGA
ncbi:hypothetical protein EDD85DRAFT_853781, partial [Armillaria nabsnona]